MRMIEIIANKRDGKELSKEEIQYWITGLTSGEIPDYQSSALLMAIVLNKMTDLETTDLTMAMMHSGDVLDLSSIKGIKVDKHSTGGVGDKTSLVLGPMVAACGAKVAKMSGRGLGHTGGTIDKLESIPGFSVSLSQSDFINQVNRISLSIVGQTGSLVPADKKLYALRDVTSTVPSISLIASSIMSKKLAAGANTILLDVKYGDGAFMQTPQQAEELAKAMIAIGQLSGRDTRALITDMNQPLGLAIGNALEVKEAIDTLKGHGPADFSELCYQAGTIMLLQAKICDDPADARKRLEDSIASGAAFKKFKEFVGAQGGDVDCIENPNKLAQAKFVTPLINDKDGFITSIKATQLGISAMKLGAGRATKDDTINPAVGLLVYKKIGDHVNVGDVLIDIHHDTQLDEEFIRELSSSFTIENNPENRSRLSQKFCNR
jgi:pyrimidine-nucleoside phosphorylase